MKTTLIKIALCFLFMSVSLLADDTKFMRIERIPHDNVKYGKINTEYYTIANIRYWGIVPVRGSVHDGEENDTTDGFVSYLDSATKIAKNPIYPIPDLKPNSYEFFTGDPCKIQLMDMKTGKIVVETHFDKTDYVWVKEKLKDKETKLSDVRYKIDLTDLPKNTAYFVFWFNTNDELYFVDKINFGFWDYNKIQNDSK